LAEERGQAEPGPVCGRAMAPQAGGRGGREAADTTTDSKRKPAAVLPGRPGRKSRLCCGGGPHSEAARTGPRAKAAGESLRHAVLPPGPPGRGAGSHHLPENAHRPDRFDRRPRSAAGERRHPGEAQRASVADRQRGMIGRAASFLQDQTKRPAFPLAGMPEGRKRRHSGGATGGRHSGGSGGAAPRRGFRGQGPGGRSSGTGGGTAEATRGGGSAVGGQDKQQPARRRGLCGRRNSRSPTGAQPSAALRPDGADGPDRHNNSQTYRTGANGADRAHSGPDRQAGGWGADRAKPSPCLCYRVTATRPERAAEGRATSWGREEQRIRIAATGRAASSASPGRKQGNGCPPDRGLAERAKRAERRASADDGSSSSVPPSDNQLLFRRPGMALSFTG